MAFRGSAKPQGVPVIARKIRLETVLKHVAPPPALVWDTLKIDIQGYDVESLYFVRLLPSLALGEIGVQTSSSVLH
jgi:hypothetical protein